MKPEFANLPVDFWVEPARIGVNQPTLCLFHDSFDTGSTMLAAIHELCSEVLPAQRKLTFAACSRERALSSLRIIAVPERNELSVMNIQHEGDMAIIEVTERGLSLLVDATESWLSGAEDFGVSPRHADIKPIDLRDLDRASGELWFWGPSYHGP